jgi:hypothetical protein
MIGWLLELLQGSKMNQILQNQQMNLKYLNSISESLNELLVEQENLVKRMHLVLLRLGPGEVLFSLEREEGKMLIFDVNLPPKSAPDVVRRLLTVKIGDSEPQVFELDGSEESKVGLRGERDAAIEISLVDVDGSGNQSLPSKATGVLFDTFPPPQPGMIGISIIGEEFEEEPVDEVVSEPDNVYEDDGN